MNNETAWRKRLIKVRSMMYWLPLEDYKQTDCSDQIEYTVNRHLGRLVANCSHTEDISVLSPEAHAVKLRIHFNSEVMDL